MTQLGPEQEQRPAVFVVHGRNLLASDAIAMALQGMSLMPIFLDDVTKNLDQWLRQLEETADTLAACVVVLQGEDLANHHSDGSSLERRARQNVIFELGYMIAKLGPDKVVVLHDQTATLPSDLGGLKTVRLEGRHAWRLELRRALSSTGIRLPELGEAEIARQIPGRGQWLHDSLQRTEAIVEDLEALLAADGDRCVRFGGLLSPFALGDPGEFAKRTGDGKALLEERTLLERCVGDGVDVKCLISPPKSSDPTIDDIVRGRCRMLLEFLSKNEALAKQVQWATTRNVEMYTYVIGDIAHYRGFKGDDASRGFALTVRDSQREIVLNESVVFDRVFSAHAGGAYDGSTGARTHAYEELKRSLLELLEDL